MLLLAKFALIVAGLVVQGVSDGAIPDGRLDRLGLRDVSTRMIMMGGLLPIGWHASHPLEIGVLWALGLAWIAAGLLKGRLGKVIWWAGLAALTGGIVWQSWTQDGVAGLATISAMLAGAGLLLLAVRWYGRRQTPPGLGRQARVGCEAPR